MTALAHNPQVTTSRQFFDSLYDTQTALENARIYLSRRRTISTNDTARAEIRHLLDQAHKLTAQATGLALQNLT
ncbi:hypothetical protein [Mycobacterium sp. D16R24]|uniref:hypothetical protein n=1 Tax=Mycobacterium sp. D16R24 TaxID=1855656 RepID=UPI000991B55C|nr:hypothetical protein [Mycobacterium sp. D16R24]